MENPWGGGSSDKRTQDASDSQFIQEGEFCKGRWLEGMRPKEGMVGGGPGRGPRGPGGCRGGTLSRHYRQQELFLHNLWGTLPRLEREPRPGLHRPLSCSGTFNDSLWLNHKVQRNTGCWDPRAGIHCLHSGPTHPQAQAHTVLSPHRETHRRHPPPGPCTGPSPHNRRHTGCACLHSFLCPQWDSKSQSF